MFHSMCFFYVAILMLLIVVPLTIKFGFKGALKWLREDNSRRGVISVGAVIIGTFFLCIFVPKVAAEEFEIVPLSHGYVTFGYDHNRKGSPQCELNDPDNKLASNLEAGVGLFSVRRDGLFFPEFSLDVFYNHQSCFVGEDLFTEDTYGVGATMILWRR